MKKSIDLLLNILNDQGISQHVICPSAKLVLRDLYVCIPDPIEIIDERSAGYVATGMCAEIDAPVVVWCADNDSYRNLTSALTEAYYRKLPILVVALECGFQIDQTINPYDTIRYYANNTRYNRIGTELEIKTAVDYLYNEVKGPVYLSVGEYRDKVVKAKIESEFVDVSAIVKMIPSSACVHIGLNVTCDNKILADVIYRHDHCTKDGNLSMLIGSSVVAENQLHIGIFMQDEIAYDLNMLGNRHIANNVIVICLGKNINSSSIYNVANRLGWECMKISLPEINTLKDNFIMGDKPQYIEVAL